MGKLSINRHYSPEELSFYLIVMLLGGMVTNGGLICPGRIALPGFFGCFGLYTVMSFLPLPPLFTVAQWYSALGFAYFGACALLSFEEKLPDLPIVSRVSSLTLEMYVTQFPLIAVFAGVPFPVGHLFCVISVIGTAYCLSLLSTLLGDRICGLVLPGPKAGRTGS